MTQEKETTPVNMKHIVYTGEFSSGKKSSGNSTSKKYIQCVSVNLLDKFKVSAVSDMSFMWYHSLFSIYLNKINAQVFSNLYMYNTVLKFPRHQTVPRFY